MIGEIIAKMFDKMIRHWKMEVAILILVTLILTIKSSGDCGAFLRWLC